MVRFMSTQQYSVTQPPIADLFTWIRAGEIAIPEIQRPFVWDATKVRNLLDSLFNGYPIGYLITWRNPDVKLKDGTSSSGKRILIDGQQRVTALMAALLGMEVINKNYKKVQIRIAFHPVRQEFEVSNPAIYKDPSWIPDISILFDSHRSLFDLVNKYCENNPETEKDEIFRSIEKLRNTQMYPHSSQINRSVFSNCFRSLVRLPFAFASISSLTRAAVLKNFTFIPRLQAATPTAVAIWVFPVPTDPYSIRFSFLSTN